MLSAAVKLDVKNAACVYVKVMCSVSELYLHVAAAASMNGRSRCDDIKAQLDTVSDQIKQAERAQHEQQHESTAAAATVDPSSSSVNPKPGKPTRSASPDLNHPLEFPARQSDDLAANAPPGNQDKKRKRHSEKSPDPEEIFRAKAGQEKKRHRTAEREGVEKVTKELSVKKVLEKLPKKLPDGEQRKHIAGDITADAAGGRHSLAAKEVEAPPTEGVQAEGTKDLPQLKKKRHLLYKQLQEARQQVLPLLHWFLSAVFSHQSLSKCPSTLTSELLLLVSLQPMNLGC